MSLLGAVRDIDRLRQITQVLVKHGFGALVARLGLPRPGPAQDDGADGESLAEVPRPQLGRRLRLVLQELGPTFVKLGQIISTRPDVIPEDIVTELKKLQDEVAPFPEQQARQQVADCLGQEVDRLFSSFEGRPLASASVAQVHRATLRLEQPGEGADGGPEEQELALALKIQRPGITDVVQRDLHLLHALAALVERAIPESRVYSPTGLVQEFDRAITAELDFNIEAENAARFARNFAGDPALRFPRVFRQVSGKRVLALEFLEGLKINEAVERGADGQWIAEEAVRLILKMVFEDGFFHADPHPGNILILPPPPAAGRYPEGQPVVIGLLDLGLVGRLSPRLRDQSVDLLMAAARNDPDAMADAMLAIGRPRQRVDQEAFRDHVRTISERHLGRGLKQMEAAGIIRDIVAGAIKFEIEIPVELTMMLRALMTIEGVGKEIHPELDVFGVARPYLTRIIWQRYHPLRLGAELARGASRLGGMARDLPFQLQEILEDLRRGRLTVRTEDRVAAAASDRLGRRVRAGLVSGALLGSGTALLLAGKLPALAWGLLAAAGVWLLVHLARDLRA
jgi:ubiquinone biosynthesis protein